MALVAAYNSDADSSGRDSVRSGRLSSVSRRSRDRGTQEPSTSQDSYFAGSGSESEDSAVRRRREAEERLTNRGEDKGGLASTLPSPLEAISGARQPDFLRPEATKPLAKPFHRSREPLTRSALTLPQEKARPERDISSMAPKLKGYSDAEKRGLPSGAVISAAAKKYKHDEGQNIVTAAQVAMLGGQWRPSEDCDDLPPSQPQKQAKGSKAMPVSDFLSKGEGGSLLPRSRQERKEREKEKRARGQSSIHGWKTEAEMVLRQQYD